jgi:hypothetical protein
MSAKVNTELHDLLAGWLPEQRWFGGKGRAIRSVEIESSAVLHEAAEDDVVVRHLLLRVDAEDGSIERYQLLVGSRTGETPQRLLHAVIGVADGATIYEAVHDTEATSTLLQMIVAGETTGAVRFTAVADDLDPTLQSRVMGAEQSNTSLVYGEDYILKVFRRLQPGRDPRLDEILSLDREQPELVAPAPVMELADELEPLVVAGGDQACSAVFCSAVFACSAIAPNATGSLTARSASTFRSSSIPAFVQPCTNWLYESPFARAAALIRVIQSFRNSRFRTFRSR